MRIKLRDALLLNKAMETVEADEKTELDYKVRLRLAVNLGILKPHIQAYSKVETAARKEVMGADGRMDGAKLILLEEKLTAIQDGFCIDPDNPEEPADLKLKMFKTADFNLSSNKRISGAQIAAMAVVIKDFGADVEDAA